MHHTGLRWDEIAEDAWRVRDPQRPQTDADAVVAYVERRRDGDYEVVWLCGTAGTAAFASLDDADRAITARYAAHRRNGSPTATKPRPIAHRPPLSPA
ncbi:hypothetical protein [Microbacterium radiodurans]|uniref:Uncharacterized protein n=1 Tax=Microbacterium radiodurans TaxID=661398 RepID=A0A5J5IYY4_9MICO|nr:hypothetical protein [Microbacterium radiodurans]KAA9089730.1 hypothetical protein F6B42_04520 [Microbacterium radiodurans]